MKSKYMVAGAFLALILSYSAVSSGSIDCAETVETEYGLVRGHAGETAGTCEWLGIPFARAPVGEYRWRAPAAHPGWSDVLDADHFGNSCMQSGIMAVEVRMSDQDMSEDCLYINVWRPGKSGKFPVMVWVHGGGYYGGSGSTPWYWGDRLAAAGDVVVVTFNYRLNVFGFMAHPSLREEDENNSVGSYGTLDQVAAVKWVHENIEAFGGDPDNVLIFGESAGGWSICTLLATPLTKGLIHRAVLHSGGCTRSRDVEKGYAAAEKVAEAVGCRADDLACLRSTPADELIDKATGEMTDLNFMPHHDGYVLADTPLAMIRAGNYNKIPFMAGFNRDEFGKAMKLTRARYTRPSQYAEQLVENYGFSRSDADTLVEMYPLQDFDNRPVEAYGRMMGVDASLACPTYDGIVAAAKQQDNTYLYRFQYDDFRMGKWMGAAHAVEIPFVFGNLDREPASLLFTRRYMDDAKKLSAVMRQYWINFARTGDPNGSALPEWPEFRPETRKLIVFDHEIVVEPAGMREKCEFWAGHDVRPPR